MGKGSASEDNSAGCALACAAIVGLALGIPSLIIGLAGEGDSCIDGTRGGIDLSDWLVGFGSEKIGVVGCLVIFTILTVFVKEAFATGLIVAVIGDVIFTVMWDIWGVVVLATNENNQCVADGTDMAIMAIIAIVLSWGTFSGGKSG